MKTEILFILDRSGSMGSCASDAVDGFNHFLKQQKKNPKGKRLTLLQFDNEFLYTYSREKLKNCKKLKLGETYSPRGMTALLDAIGFGLQKIKDAKKAVVTIYTDGYENASKEYNESKVKKLVEKAKKKDWEVIFMAAEINPQVAYNIGFSKHKVAVVNKGDIFRSMDVACNYTTAYAATGLVKTGSLQEDHDTEASTK
jgi:hypothetical protein